MQNAGGRLTPITVLHGFLGSGKTTLLQQWLNNKDGRQVGVVVNDMAEVNIDSELVQTEFGDASDFMLQLENGCACCSLGDDMINSIEHLIRTAAAQNRAYDHIIVECSGVAEPVNTRSKFLAAVNAELDIAELGTLANLVTVVDASTFLQDFACWDTLGARGDLGEWQAGDLRVWGGQRKHVVELLMSQVEVADVIVINKSDTVPTVDALARIQKLVRLLNPTASVITTEWGHVPLSQVLQASGQSKQTVLQDDEEQHVHALQALPEGSAARHIAGEALRSADVPIHSTNTAPQIRPGERAEVPAWAFREGAPCFTCEQAPAVTTSNEGPAAHVAHVVYRARRPFNVHRLQELLRGLHVDGGGDPAQQPCGWLELAQLNAAAGKGKAELKREVSARVPAFEVGKGSGSARVPRL
ncbi:hypothetical protein CYMTET_21293, partial [Cymbomonas tetramitiformis]